MRFQGTGEEKSQRKNWDFSVSGMNFNARFVRNPPEDPSAADPAGRFGPPCKPNLFMGYISNRPISKAKISKI
jgi:hypothetical protein